MSFRCSKCGSRNHAAYDCLTPDPAYVHVPDPEPEPEASVPVSAPVVIIQLKFPPEGYSGPLPLVLEPPRFKGCPPICPVANLPAFLDASLADKFHKENAPDWAMDHLKACKWCGSYHYLTHRISGGERYSEYPSRNWQPFIRSSTLFEHRRLPESFQPLELPKHEVEEVKKPIAPAPKKVQSKALELFGK